MTLLVTWGWVTLQFESTNHIAEQYVHDISNQILNEKKVASQLNVASFVFFMQWILPHVTGVSADTLSAFQKCLEIRLKVNSGLH